MQRTKHRKKSWMWMTAIGLALGLAACGIDTSDEPTTDETSSAIQPGDGVECPPVGVVVCPLVPDGEVEYGPPPCGYPSLPALLSVCNQHCDVPCRVGVF